MSTNPSDLDALAERVRDFIDQEVPDVDQWNVNPDVLRDSLTMLREMIADLLAAQTALEDSLASLVDPATGQVRVSEWVPEPVTPTYLGPDKLALTGDRRADYRVGDRIRAALGPTTATTKVVCTVTGSTFSPDTTTLTLSPGSLTPQLRALEHGLVRTSVPTDLIPDAVIAAHIAANAVAVRNLQPAAVTDPAIADLAIKSRHIAAGAVLSAAIAANQVNAGHIGDQQILYRHLGKYQVLSDNVGQKQIGAFHIADRTITAAQIATGSIGGNEITDLSVGANDIADGQIFGGAFFRNHIADKSIWADSKLANRSIWGATQIALNSISVNELAAGAALPYTAVASAGINALFTPVSAWVEVAACSVNFRGGWLITVAQIDVAAQEDTRQLDHWCAINSNGGGVASRKVIHKSSTYSASGAMLYEIPWFIIGAQWVGAGTYRQSAHVWEPMNNIVLGGSIWTFGFS